MGERRTARAPRGFYGRRAKAWLDACLLFPAVPLALLLGLPIALVNALLFGDPRKVFYAQERVGRGGRRFPILKFRTMRDAHGPAFDAPADAAGARVTRFGRFLRCTHLDELPQVANVLLGHMSFVGPRPEMVAIADWARERLPGFDRRHCLKPGITGLAQVTLGYAVPEVATYRRKLAADERYLEQLSLSLDLRILWRTALWMLRGRGWSWREGPLAGGRRSADGRGPGPAPAAALPQAGSSGAAARREVA